MSAILRIANLCKTYKITNTQKQDVLKGIDLELDTGELVALLGESGCGKSTMINIIGGLDTDYTGSVVIKGKFIRDFNEKQMDDYRKKRVGLIFQNYNLVPHMTVEENVEIAMQMSDIDQEARKKRTEELLNMVGLLAHGSKYPNQLSGGQKQRVAIARALANNPSIILADEPTGALDKEASVQVLNILKKISEMGKLVIIVTHSSTVAEACSRVVSIDDGVVKSDITKEKPKKTKYEKYQEVEPKNIKNKEIVQLSLRNLWTNRSRNLLVSLGISIGIAALILILALSQGITNYVKEYYAEDELSTVIAVTSNRSSLSSSHVDNIKSIDGVSSATKSYMAKSVSYSYSETTGTITNVYESLSANRPEILYGSSVSSSSEMVVDLTVATSLSEDGAIGVIGKGITLTYQDISLYFTIVGIFDSSSAGAYIYPDAMTSFFSGSKETNVIYVQVKDITYLDAVCDEISDLGLSTKTQENSSSVILDYIDLGTSVLTGVAAIATAVSAIMIIIVLYISVIERTQEIGILRSIGARRKDISKLFMVQAGLLGILGGLLGVVFALIIAGITNIVCTVSANFMFISFNPVYYFIGFAVSLLVSILAGIIPSRKASGLDPVEALRFE